MSETPPERLPEEPPRRRGRRRRASVSETGYGGPPVDRYSLDSRRRFNQFSRQIPPEDPVLARASAERKRLEARVPKDRPVAGGANWTPLGPSVVANGQATGNPAVSGRVVDVAIAPGGDRLYAGSASGGVWFSADAGATWTPLDDYAISPWRDPAAAASPAAPAMDAASLSVGAVAARFGATVADDVCFAGTGEPQQAADAPRVVGVEPFSYFGIGVRVFTGGPGGTVTLEGTNLAAHGIFALAIDPAPADPDNPLVLAAASNGLFARPTDPAASRASWPAQAPLNAANPSQAVCALTVARSGTTTRWYCALWGGGVFESPDGAAWTAIGGLPSPSPGRIALGAAPSDARIVYALLQDGRLFRRRQTGGFVRVHGMPPLLRGGQGFYDLAVVVDPDNPDIVVLGGDAQRDGPANSESAEWNASLWRGRVRSVSGQLRFPFDSANASRPWRDLTWIGRGAHADVHVVRFAPRADGTLDGAVIWAGTDGGLFRSTDTGASWSARGSGMATLQVQTLAQHPTNDALVLAGAQDNGTLRWNGSATWWESPKGDGGGIAIDTSQAGPPPVIRAIRQSFNANLDTCLDGGTSGGWSGVWFPPGRASAVQAQRNAAEQENGWTPFYGPLAVSPTGRVAFGTYRVWLSEDWGRTWATLPTGTTPYDPNPVNLGQDSLGAGVIALVWASPTRLFVATATAIWQFDGPAAGFAGWTSPATALPAFPAPANVSAARPITDLAVADAAAGSVYVTLGGAAGDHVWFHDPADAANPWVTVGRPSPAFDAPAQCLVVDPAHPEDVYVGFDVGVWRARRAGGTWGWTAFSPGLPECPVQDLVIHSGARVLRAATYGRGVWEIALDAAAGRDTDVYVRANLGDAGRRLPSAAAGQPDPTAAGQTLTLDSSPDLVVRRGTADTVAAPARTRTLRRRTPPMTGADVTAWQQRMVRRGWALAVNGRYDAASEALCLAFQRAQGMRTDGIVGPLTWGRSMEYPALAPAAEVDQLGFVTSVGPDTDRATRVMLADAGPNRLFFQFHNRGHVAAVAGTTHALAVLTTVAAGAAPPALPAGWRARVTTGDTGTGWLGGSWRFLDGATPYRQAPGDVEARHPRVVSWPLELTGVPVGNDAIVVAFVAAMADPLTSDATDVPTLVMADRHVACRRVRVVAP